jgi:membrane associated rhomboid family serine protease
MFLFALLLVAALAIYVMSPDDRRRLVRAVAEPLRNAGALAGLWRLGRDDAFQAALRARVRWPLVTYALVAANVAVFAMMLAGPGALDDPATLVAWGGNFGPHTTGGERWRVLTSIFVHRGVLHLLVTVAALVQLGLLLERVVGPFTFGTMVLAAGVFGSIVSSAAAPMSVVVGATGAIFGLYGLLVAAALRGLLPGTAVRIPLRELARLAPMAAVFVLYFLASGEPSITAKAGLCAGLIGGLALTRSIRDQGARLRRFAALGTATAAIVMMSAMALRAVTDIRPAIAAVVADEERTAAIYDAVVVRFTNGRMTARELAQVIDGNILPDLRRARERVDALIDVPAEEVSLVAAAQEYLRLRQDSWRARAQALRTNNMHGLRNADETAQASLRVFERIASAVEK